MTAQINVPLPEPREVDVTAIRRQGVVAGLLGAALLAVWFLYLDVSHGRPLYTPTLLGMSLVGLGGVDHPEAIRGELMPTVLFTLVHGVVFALIGVGTAQILISFGRLRSRALVLFLVWGTLCLAFFGFALIVAVVGPQTIPMRDAFVGNLIAAAGMAAYLGRAVEHLRSA